MPQRRRAASLGLYEEARTMRGPGDGLIMRDNS